MKKILIFHTSVGLGHKFIAQNIGWHLKEAGYQVEIADIGQVQKGKFERYVTVIHRFINRNFSSVWAFLYKYGYYIILPFREFIAGFNFKSALKYINEYKPDLIITTQTTASAVVAYLKQKKLYNNKFAIAFSDYHIHSFWLYSQADFYLINTQEQKSQMVAKGIQKTKIFVCGIVLKPKVDVNVEEIKNRMGVEKNIPVVLIGTGSLGLGFDLKDLQDLLKIEKVKIIFACGKNLSLYESVKKMANPKIIPLTFYESMSELYAMADIFIGKPGGLSTAEALQWNLPLLVTFTLPGQEELNIKYLVERNLIMLKTPDLFSQVTKELQSCEFKEQLRTSLYISKIVSQSAQLLEAVKINIGL